MTLTVFADDLALAGPTVLPVGATGRAGTAIAITVASLEKSWDDKYGGMRYLANLDGTPMFPPQADQKLWWPHAEALYALLLGWAATGRDDLATWYYRIHEYAFSHFPDCEFGEWYGYLNRDGSVMFTAKANGWKGFFHLPRVFLRNYLLLAGCGSRFARGAPSRVR